MVSNVGQKRRSLPGWEGEAHGGEAVRYITTTTRKACENTLLIMPKNPSSRQHGSVATTNLRRGAFPGSFNPLTVAHLEIARLARERHGLDEVHLIVSETALDKPHPPGPSFEARIAALEADANAHDWLFVATTGLQLIADIAGGFDLVIMGADKWSQVNDVAYYDDEAHRDAAIARLPAVVVAERHGTAVIGVDTLETSQELRSVSSSRARDGEEHLMAPEARKRWKDA